MKLARTKAIQIQRTVLKVYKVVNTEYVKNDIADFWDENFQEVLSLMNIESVEKAKEELAQDVIRNVEFLVRRGYGLSDAYSIAREKFLISPDKVSIILEDEITKFEKIMKENGVF